MTWSCTHACDLQVLQSQHHAMLNAEGDGVAKMLQAALNKQLMHTCTFLYDLTTKSDICTIIIITAQVTRHICSVEGSSFECQWKGNTCDTDAAA